MTAHGAYTKAAHAASEIKELGATTYKNIKAMYSAYPLPDDPAMIDELNAIAGELKAAGEGIAVLRERAFTVAERYLEANAARVKKGYVLEGKRGRFEA